MLLIGLAIIALAAPLAAGYDSEFDKLDVDKIVADDALMEEYLDCFLDKGPCKGEFSSEIKKLLPEVIATACEKCTPIQKSNTRKFVNTVFLNKPNRGLELNKKFDPTGEHQAKFAAFLTTKE